MRININMSKALPIVLVVSLTTLNSVTASSETGLDASKSSEPVSSVDHDPFRTVPFVTLRNKTGSEEAAEYYGGERDMLQAGLCKLARTQLNSLKTIAEMAPFYIPGPFWLIT